jgi:hypothetical protein
MSDVGTLKEDLTVWYPQVATVAVISLFLIGLAYLDLNFCLDHLKASSAWRGVIGRYEAQTEDVYVTTRKWRMCSGISLKQYKPRRLLVKLKSDINLTTV